MRVKANPTKAVDMYICVENDKGLCQLTAGLKPQFDILRAMCEM